MGNAAVRVAMWRRKIMRLGTPEFLYGVFRIAVYARPAALEVHIVQTLHWREHVNSTIACSRGIYWPLTGASGIAWLKTVISSSCYGLARRTFADDLKVRVVLAHARTFWVLAAGAWNAHRKRAHRP